MTITIKNGHLKNVPEEWYIFNVEEAEEAEEVLYFHPILAAVQPMIAFMPARRCENCFISHLLKMTNGYTDNRVWYIGDQPLDLFPCGIYVERTKG